MRGTRFYSVLTTALAVGVLAVPAAAQQRGRAIDVGPPFNAELVADLAEPWAMTFLPDGRMLVTEKRGTLHLVTREGQVSRAISGVPPVVYNVHGGLGDVVLHPSFAENGLVYLTWAEAGEGGTSGAAMGRGRLNPETLRLEGFEVLWRQTPKVAQERHYSYRMAFSPDGQHLFVTSGDRWMPETAQDNSDNLGAVLRLTPDGRAAPGNPMYSQGGATAEIWSYGHRSLVGIAFNAQGELWETEMGPTGGDELQRIEPGLNYGWPLVSYGDNYRGGDIPGHDTRPDLRAPEAYWNPVISPTSMIFYSGDLFPEWRGSALLAGLTSKALIRVTFQCTLAFRTICEAERFPLNARLREVEQGPDGAVWLLEDGGGGDDPSAGRLIRLAPRGSPPG
ncbi:PQQ-dependent sugar dehydrogenase [Sphingosinicella sp. LHD-64]|uniref:PQQ-dependent sugar dehydrogenase n=1 Tax=Sphingosinicella sp. LHD-64 TaxID=3072139 RepID=UPI00280F7120|nr:PQQ-dependent sugar dehydrogenase [Sphingosinicella sp. LHD-64]MDQ8755867.1 PQQ-dependent sugar dehydrogenase [Sphingosinicella sp. LHD-64]